tara:strand:- start:1196 stop:1396 length:201 start_codon:yes stop_codon:yes gene_type:complete
MTQSNLILAHLKKHGKINWLEAYEYYNSSRLAARIYDLRQDGYNIQKFNKRLKNKKIVAEYKLLGD